MSGPSRTRPIRASRSSGAGLRAHDGLTRRSFLELAAPLTVAWPLAASLTGASKIPLALQLYSVRADCQADFDSALEKVAAMGFAGVEFAGYYGYADRPGDLRKRLDALHLEAAGTHIALDALLGDARKKTIDFHRAIGCRFLVVPSHPDFTNAEKCKALADTFNEIAAALKPVGMACGYHNHQNEFKLDGDKTFWDWFAERTTKDVILQQDCGWTFAAGFDPVEYVRKYRGRTKTVHFKPTVKKDEAGRSAILGQDSVDWKSVYAACVAAGGTQWIVLEQEVYPDGKPPMDCTRESFAGLRRLIG
jgi:sugar phosphate isomerase/epimerase